jgi:LDH2 family malate/lactate/ureidoglycolate dehydrogenase
MRRLLVAAGCDSENAAASAEAFLEADLRSVGLQGLDHMSTIIGGLRCGRIKGNARPRVVKDAAAYALIDGGAGPGQVASIMAADLAVAKAKAAGCASVGVTNSSDLYMIGYYAERMARAGVVGLAFSDSPPLVRPYGGVERRLGTNPLAIGVPTGGDYPVVLDMATSARSASRVRQAAYHDEDLPEAEGVDAEGRSSASAAAVRDGAIGPLGGHKGFGLALCVALLAGPLTGSATGRGLQAWLDLDPAAKAPKGHLFIAIDPAAFGDPAAFRAAVSGYLADIKSSRKAPGVTEIRIPGERSLRARAECLRTGRVRLYDAVWVRIVSLAQELGVDVPEAKLEA